MACGEDKHPGQVKTPGASGFYEGRDYHYALKDFQEKGFANIILEPKEDLITGWITKEDECEKVYVGGDPTYSADQWVPAETEVKIVYHTFPSGTDDKTSEKENADEVEKEEPTTTPTEEVEVPESIDTDNEEEPSSKAEEITEEKEETEQETESVDNGDETVDSSVPSSFQINIDDASDYFDQCVRDSCPYGVKIHQLGRIESPINDTTLFIKKKVDVENAFGNKVEMYAYGSVELKNDSFSMNDLVFE